MSFDDDTRVGAVELAWRALHGRCMDGSPLPSSSSPRAPVRDAAPLERRDRRGRRPNEELRKRVLAEYPTCASPRELAKSLGVTYEWLRVLASRLKLRRDQRAVRCTVAPAT